MKRRKSHKPSRKTQESDAAFYVAWEAMGVLAILKQVHQPQVFAKQKKDMSRVQWFKIIANDLEQLAETLEQMPKQELMAKPPHPLKGIANANK